MINKDNINGKSLLILPYRSFPVRIHLSRMYPRLSDFINDLFGTSLRLPVQTYGFFVAMAFLAGGWLLYLELKRKEKSGIIHAREKMVRKGRQGKVRQLVHPYQLTPDIILVAALFGLVGSKLFDIVEHLGAFARDPFGMLFSFSGLTFYGGLIAAALAVCIYSEKHGIPWPVIADAVAPGLMLAYGIGRIGCQLAGDGCWGVVNPEPKPEALAFLPNWLWAFDYPGNVLREGIVIPGCEGDHCYRLGQPVFPTPIYETTIAVIFFGALWSIRTRIGIPGTLFSIYLILNGTGRFFIEKIRVNIRYSVLGLEVTQAEMIAVGLIIAGIALLIYFRRRHHRGILQKSKHEPGKNKP